MSLPAATPPEKPLPVEPKTVRVVVPLPLSDAYDYLPLAGAEMPAGTVVQVPFGARTLLGVVWGAGLGDVPPEKLKAVLGVADLPPVPDDARRFVDWVADYTLSPRGAVMKMMFGNLERMQPKKKDVVPDYHFQPDYHQPQLTDAQRHAAAHLVAKLHQGSASVTLLDGVTGSGKTEVFCEAIAACLRQGRQALLLLPEIAMTAALLDRLAARFGEKPVVWHSELSEKQRRLNWHAIAQGKAGFVVGARSALFLPYAKLGLIIVDEEHEAAYKQEEGVIYQGRDMAVVRGHGGGFPVVLSSATPSLETLFNIRQGKYDSVRLPERYGAATMPEITLVDLRQQNLRATEFISAPLEAALRETLAAGQQAMLFLNRRGYAPLTLCRACGHRLQCPHCSSWLIEHKKTGRLHCHHCGLATAKPDTCPACGVADKFAACGPGVERVAEEARARFPDARIAIMASDTLAGPEAAQALVDQMHNHDLDLLIGTQIMAKGYHFPRLTLVGVVDGDLGLAGGDPRAAERTFQLLQQMAGRSGRAGEAGRVLLQTTSPEHPVMQALLKNDRDGFMEAELAEREAYHLPPVWRLASLTISGAEARQVIAFAEQLARAAPQVKDIKLLGPAPAAFAMLRGKYRHRLLLQAPRGSALHAYLKAWIGVVRVPRHLRLIIDIDPYSFL